MVLPYVYERRKGGGGRKEGHRSLVAVSRCQWRELCWLRKRKSWPLLVSAQASTWRGWLPRWRTTRCVRNLCLCLHEHIYVTSCVITLEKFRFVCKLISSSWISLRLWLGSFFAVVTAFGKGSTGCCLPGGEQDGWQEIRVEKGKAITVHPQQMRECYSIGVQRTCNICNLMVLCRFECRTLGTNHTIT